MRTLIRHKGKVPVFENKVILVGEFIVPPIIPFSYVQSCCGGGGLTGCIDLTVSGTNPPFTYQWYSTVPGFSSNAQDLVNLLNGTYYCIITDNIGNTQSTGDIVINCP